MPKNGRLRLLLPLALAVIGLLAIAAGLSNLRLGPGEPTINLFQLMLRGFSNLRVQSTVPDDLPSSDGLFALLRIVTWIAIPAAVVYAFISARFRKRLVSMVFLVIAVSIVLDRLDLFNNQEGQDGGDSAAGGPGGAEEALPPVPELISSPPAWLTAAIAAGLALLIVGSVWLVWRRMKALEPDARAEVVQAAEQTLADLDAGADVKDAVIRCYADMTRHFGADRKLKRRRGMTPREFSAHLAGAGLNDEHIHRLTRLFEAVRYGGLASSEAMALEARACLSAVVGSYGRAAR